jgi:hypothetical protein
VYVLQPLDPALVARPGAAGCVAVRPPSTSTPPRWCAHAAVSSPSAPQWLAPKTVDIFLSAGLTAQLRRAEELDATVVVGAVLPGTAGPGPGGVRIGS